MDIASRLATLRKIRVGIELHGYPAMCER